MNRNDSGMRAHVLRAWLLNSVLILLGAGVEAEAGSLSIGWNAPVVNADGTPLTDLASYRIYLGTSAPACPGTPFRTVTSSTTAPPSGLTVSTVVTGLTAGTTYFARITAVDSAGNESTCTPAASGVAQGDFGVTPSASTNFGSVTTGTAVDRAFTVQNTSAATISGTATVAPPFSVVSGGPFTVPAGASQTVTVRFQPTTTGTFASNVVFTVGSDSVSRSVSGTGTASTTVTLSVTKNGTGSGDVTSPPAGIACGTACSVSLAAGTQVILTATPGSGSTFAGWSGPCSGTAACSVTVNASTAVTATFILSAAPTAGEIVIDNANAGVQDSAGGRTFTGRWCQSNATGQFGPDSLVSCGNRRDTYRWTPRIQAAGDYDVYVWWAASPSRSTSVPITVVYAGGSNTRVFNERAGGGQWVLHGRYTFNAGTSGYVETSDANGSAGADAVRLAPATAQSSSAPPPSGSPAAGPDFTTTGLVAGQVVTTPIRVQNFPAVGTGQVFDNFGYEILDSTGATVFTNLEFSQPYCLAGDDGTACFFWDPASVAVGAYTVRITMTHVESGVNKAVVKTIPFSVAR